VKPIKAEGEAAYGLFLFRLRQSLGALIDERERQGERQQIEHFDDELKHLFDEYESLYEVQQTRSDPDYSHRLFQITLNHQRFRVFASDGKTRKVVKARLRMAIGEITQEIQAAQAGASETARLLVERARQQVDDDTAAWEASTPTNTHPVLTAFKGDQTPLGQLWKMVNSGLKWKDDSRCPRKGYILACLSELLYLQMSKVDFVARIGTVSSQA
jgi:hypothetical protein